MTRAYYNEIDPFAVAVLREQIASDVIAQGDVDDRSIEDVTANDLKGYTQAHFFAGGGFWSVAARLAGWPDDKPLWTGSCPCQPFSVAGKGRGTDDPRHLWPHLFRIVRGTKAAGFGPSHLVGEQVSGTAGYGWFDGVRADLAQEGYASRAVDVPACAIDAPHQRNRLFWIALDNGGDTRLEGQCRDGNRSKGRENSPGSTTEADDFILANARHELRRQRPAVPQNREVRADDYGILQPDADSCGRDGRQEISQREAQRRATVERVDDGICAADELQLQLHGPPAARQQSFVEPDSRVLQNGSLWSEYEWIVSPIDGKARRAKPSISFLVDGLSNRVGLWRIAGGAIVPQIAAEVLKALLEVEHMRSAA